MILRLIWFAIIALAILPTEISFAQPDRDGYHIRHYTDEDGLPQNSIHNMLFDDNGQLWLASQLGLVRFDGNSFKVFDRAGFPGMESTRIRYLSKGANGNIYFQTDDRRLFLFGEKGNSLIASCDDSAGAKGRLLNERKQVFDFTGFLSGRTAGESPDSRALIFKDLRRHSENFYPVSATSTYINYHDTLFYFDGKRLSKLAGTVDPDSHFLVLQDRLYIIGEGDVRGFYQNGIKTGEKQTIEGVFPKDGGHPANRTYHYQFYPGKSPHLLVDKKLYRLRNDAIGRLTADFLLDLDFIEHASDVEYDPTLDILLVSTETEGFYLIRKDKFQSSYFKGPLKDLLSGYLFGPVALNKKDNSILTAQFVFNEAGQYHLLNNIFPSYPKCLFVDDKDHIWSTTHNIIQEYNQKFEIIKSYPAVDKRVVDFKQDSEGNVYCLTENALWQLKADSFRRIFVRTQLSLKGINESLNFAVPGKCWIANENGLIEYDLATGKAGLIKDVGDAHIRSIYKCEDGSVLLGSYGQGYFYYRQGHFHKPPPDKKRFLVTAHSFLEDRAGHLWISCNKGLFELLKKDLDSWCETPEKNGIYYYYYGRQDGLQTNEFNGGFNNAGLITNNGFVTLLSMKGLVCFHTDSLKPDLPTGPLSVSEIEIDGKPNPKKDSLVLGPDYRSLSLEVSSPFLGNPNNLYLQYWIGGAQKEWLDVPDDGKIKLNGLTPGDYILRVRKMNGFGSGNYSFKSIRIGIVPHFYQTSWFAILAGLAALLFLVLFIQLRLNLVEKKKEVRIKAEKLKGTVITLEETVEKLRESQRALLQTNKVREKLISLVIHDLRSPIRFLSLLANDLHDHITSFSDEEKKERSYWIKKGTNDIYNFSEDFLLWATSQKDNFNLVKRNFFIKPLLQEIHDFYKEQVLAKGNTILYEAPDDLTLHSDPHILITIIRNLVDNANKYTEKGSITVRACRQAENIIVSVTDTGKGMSREQINMFLKDDGLEGLKSGSQLGHKFVFDLAKRIDAALSIESGTRGGTSIKLSFAAEE